jgi:predicted esterase
MLSPRFLLVCAVSLAASLELAAFAPGMDFEEKCERSDEIVVFEVEKILTLPDGLSIHGHRALARCRVVDVLAGIKRRDETRTIPTSSLVDPSYPDLIVGRRYLGFLQHQSELSVPVHYGAVAEIKGGVVGYRGEDWGEEIGLEDLRSRVQAVLAGPPPGWMPFRSAAGLLYRAYHPGSAVAPGDGLPLVIVLHGSGSRGDDNTAQMRQVPLQFAPRAGPRLGGENRRSQDAVVLAPQCPPGLGWTGEILEKTIALAREWAARPEIDSQRVYFCGWSMGGAGTWEALAIAPDLITAAVSVCGWGRPASAGRFRHIPVRVYHGDADRVIPVERSREMVESIQSVGGMVEYIELPGVEHDAWTPAFVEGSATHWLLRQRRGDARPDPSE